MINSFLTQLLQGDNNPLDGSVCFDSSDHVRFKNNRRLVIEKNIQDGEGYTVTLYNLDGIHPLWKDNVQMAPKRMKIVGIEGNIVELRGYGYDENALAMGVPLEVASFENYGVLVMIENNEILRAQLNMFDRNISIVYLK